MIQNKQDHIVNLTAEQEEIKTNANNIMLQIFDLFFQYSYCDYWTKLDYVPSLCLLDMLI